MEKITNYKKNFHEIPGGTSRYIHGIFLDPKLRKLLVGTFFLGTVGNSLGTNRL